MPGVIGVAGLDHGCGAAGLVHRGLRSECASEGRTHTHPSDTHTHPSDTHTHPSDTDGGVSIRAAAGWRQTGSNASARGGGHRVSETTKHAPNNNNKKTKKNQRRQHAITHATRAARDDHNQRRASSHRNGARVPASAGCRRGLRWAVSSGLGSFRTIRSERRS
eukprot:769377-Rhodomonas_salina.1